MMDPESALRSLGLSLPTPPTPVASYVPWVWAGELVYISGQVSKLGDRAVTGRVPSVCDRELAMEAAGICALNLLAVLKDALEGDWSRLVRLVKLQVFVASDPGFEGQPQVANGASDLLVEVLGEPGRHTRAAVGVASLPLGVAVEADLVAQGRV